MSVMQSTGLNFICFTIDNLDHLKFQPYLKIMHALCE